MNDDKHPGEPRPDSTANPGRPFPSDSSPDRPGATPFPYQPGYGDDGRDNDFHLIDYVRIVYKRRRLAWTAFALILGSVMLYTFTVTPQYLARVQILIETESPKIVKFEEVYEQNKEAEDYYQTQYRLLRSRQIARRALDSQQLWDNPQFGAPSKWAWVTDPLRRGIDAVRGTLGSARVEERPDRSETRVQSQVIDAFLRGLTVTPVRNSRLVDVLYESPDPKLSAQLANAVAHAYIQQNIDFKFRSSKDASTWLEQQLGEQRKKVETSEYALQRYREDNDAVSLEERQNIVVQKLADLNAALTRLKTERIQKETSYNQIRDAQDDKAALDTIQVVNSNAFIQQQKSELANLQRQQAAMSNRLGPRHPDMVKIGLEMQNAEAKIQGEIGKIVQAMRNDFEQTVAQERSLSAALEQQKRDAQDLNRKGVEYGVLARGVTADRQIFDTLTQRTKETGISGELRTTNVQVVDEAEIPGGPSSPNILYNLLFGLFGGAVFAIGLAFGLEYMDNRIKSPEEVIHHLGLPFLGMIPAIFDGRNPMIGQGVAPGFSESFRTLRTNLLFSAAQEGGRNVVVTSTSPGEGKTIVAVNLAIALAQAGERVLLIDADLRRPRVHEMFEHEQEPGLSNVLVGQVKPSQAIHRTTVGGLWALPAGVCPPNPAELLGSARFKDFLEALRPYFDWFVVDTPPVMAVTDSALVSHLATHVLFVVGSEMTSRYAAQRALDQLQRVRARVIGAVLNRVDITHNGYYYSHYYRRDYARYYHDATTVAR